MCLRGVHDSSAGGGGGLLATWKFLYNAHGLHVKAHAEFPIQMRRISKTGTHNHAIGKVRASCVPMTLEVMTPLLVALQNNLVKCNINGTKI